MLKNELNYLKDKDIWTLILFILYKTKDIPEYSSLSQLCYLLDKDSLLKLCEFFGGTTIRIPTLDELEIIVYALLMYQYIDIEHLSYDEALVKIQKISNKKYENRIKTLYNNVKKITENYNFQQ